MVKSLLNHFTVLLGAALFMPVLSIFLHYLNVLPHRTTACYLQPTVFDGLTSGLLLIVFGISYLILFAGIIMHVKAKGSHKIAQKRKARKLLVYGAVGMISIALSFYIFGGFSVGWYGLPSDRC